MQNLVDHGLTFVFNPVDQRAETGRAAEAAPQFNFD